MRDILNRRNRARRCNSGKNLKLTTRDTVILSLLYRYRFLSSQDLINHIEPKSEKRFIERLGHLFHDGAFVNRPKEQWNLPHAHYAAIVYTLSGKGLQVLKSSGELPQKAVIYPKKSNGGVRQQFIHTLKISQAISNAEKETMKTPNQRFVPLDEIRNRQLAKGKPFKLEFPVTIPVSKHNPHSVCRTTVRPDGLYGIEYTDTGKPLYQFFAVEVDLSTPENRNSFDNSSIRKRKLAYNEAIKSGSYKGALGIPNLAVQMIRE